MDYSLPAQSNEASYREMFGAVRRQKWLILSIIAGFLVAALLLILVTPPQYMSSRTVVVEGRTQTFNNEAQDAMRSVELATQEDLPTQIEVLQSQTILSQVLDKVVSLEPELTPKSASDPNVVARQVAGTNAVEVQVFSASQRLAQEVAEGIPDAFSDYVKNIRRQGVQRAITNLEDQLGSERKQAVTAQSSLDSFRREHSLSPSDSEAAELSQQKERAETDLVEAKADLASQLENVQSITLQKKTIPPTVPQVTRQSNDVQIQQANDKLGQLEVARDQLLIEYQADAPQVAEANAQIDSQRRYLKRIPKELTTSQTVRNPLLESTDASLTDATSRLAGSRARAKEKSAYLDSIDKRLQEYNLLLSKLDELKRNVGRRNDSVQQLQTTFNNIVPLRDAVGEPVKALSPASQPSKSKPNPPLYVIVALVIGSIVASVVALARERIQDRVNSLEDAYRIADAPTLGYVPPRIFGRNAKRTGKLPSRVMENYRIVRSNVLFSSREQPFRSLMVTSTGRGEGKSEVAANLAIAMASGGKRVLLVDAHVHSPSVHDRFGVSRGPGLAEVLGGDADLIPSVKSSEIENLFVLSAGERKVSLADGLGGGAMTRLHEAMIEAFDLVIFDTPPMLPRSDALTLSSTVETVVYVVRPGETTKTLMKYCLELLRHAHARLLGVVFTNTEFYEEAA